MSGISTHVLDISRGMPAAKIRVSLFQENREIGKGITDADGRCQLLSERATPGTYRIVFETSTYFPDGFYPQVSIFFLVRDAGSNYHVPLLISPFGFSTYRGS